MASVTVIRPEPVPPTVKLSLTPEEAEGLRTLLGGGVSIGVADALGLRDIVRALSGAGFSYKSFQFGRIAQLPQDV